MVILTECVVRFSYRLNKSTVENKTKARLRSLQPGFSTARNKTSKWEGETPSVHDMLTEMKQSVCVGGGGSET